MSEMIYGCKFFSVQLNIYVLKINPCGSNCWFETNGSQGDKFEPVSKFPTFSFNIPHINLKILFCIIIIKLKLEMYKLTFVLCSLFIVFFLIFCEQHTSYSPVCSWWKYPLLFLDIYFITWRFSLYNIISGLYNDRFLNNIVICWRMSIAK